MRIATGDISMSMYVFVTRVTLTTSEFSYVMASLSRESAMCCAHIDAKFGGFSNSVNVDFDSDDEFGGACMVFEREDGARASYVIECVEVDAAIKEEVKWTGLK